MNTALLDFANNPIDRLNAPVVYLYDEPMSPLRWINLAFFFANVVALISYRIRWGDAAFTVRGLPFVIAALTCMAFSIYADFRLARTQKKPTQQRGFEVVKK